MRGFQTYGGHFSEKKKAPAATYPQAYRDALARHGTEDPEIYGTARHGKSWHGKSWHGTARKILARKNIGTAWPGKHIIHIIVDKIFYGCEIRFCPDPKSHF